MTLARLTFSVVTTIACALVLAGMLPASAAADDPLTTNSWSKGSEVRRGDAAAGKGGNTTVIERGGKALGTVKLVALLTVDGQEIDQGLVWRIFAMTSANPKPKLLAESREASPSMKLPPGDYTINAAFGRANLTRRIAVKPDAPSTENFVLNAGGLRVAAFVSGKPAPQGAVTYSIYSDEREQFSGRTAIMSNAKPSLVIRLNSGIYRIISQYGDANAKIEADVTVEAGKLSETSVMHVGGRVTFKLVTRSGGEAVPDTRWTVQSDGGEIVKESVGALPTHILAPGSYVVAASSGGQRYQRRFEVKDGEVKSVEVLMGGSRGQDDGPPLSSIAPTTAAPSGAVPSFGFKSQ